MQNQSVVCSVVQVLCNYFSFLFFNFYFILFIYLFVFGIKLSYIYLLELITEASG